MACFWLHHNITTITIPATEEIDSVTYYIIEITVSDVTWRVSRRYNDFYVLHNQLVNNHGLTKDILPPKKVIHNKSASFIESRRNGLTRYLRYILSYLRRTMPLIFVDFLQFNTCDIFFLLQSLAIRIGNNSLEECHVFNPLELHALSEFIKNPFPEVEHSDLSYVLEYCLELKELYIEGSDLVMTNTNLIPNTLPFELSSFKSLETLQIKNINFSVLYQFGGLRKTLTKFNAHKTQVTGISEILQCDVLHKSTPDASQIWSSLVEIDFSSNNLTEIDESINLAPNTQILCLNQNKISCVTNLSALTKLVTLSISDNLITSCDNLHMKLGNVQHLNLSQNNITSLSGFSKLYSLQTLDLNSNHLCNIEEVDCLGDLQCLENLILTGNAISTTMDYRIKVLESFSDRSDEICLDNERPSEAELDKVAIFRALKIVKEGRTPIVNNIMLN